MATRRKPATQRRRPAARTRPAARKPPAARKAASSSTARAGGRARPVAGRAKPAAARAKPERALSRPTAKPARKSSKSALPRAGAGQRRQVPNPHLNEILAALRLAYPDAQCALEHQDAFQLLIATILSAQCTDARVNIVTRDLFQRYRTPRDFAEASQEEIEEAIRSTGFYRNKAKAIRTACQAIVEQHGGRVPDTMEQLGALHGVGRKTANVVLGNAYGRPDGVVVDTHVKRITYKLALTNQTNPDKIEQDLNAIVPREEWVAFSHEVILHGRKICSARAPKCDQCVLYPYCPTRA